MPYIKKERRDEMRAIINEFRRAQLYPHRMSTGDLNYIITSLINSYIEHNGESYDIYNSCIGVLECAKLELYRRPIAAYENKKIKSNGDL